ncbi:MAG: hypothetical protein ACK5OB_17410 [Pirellula sp.]
MNLRFSVPSMNRLLFAGVTLAGLFAVLLSLKDPWFSVPMARDGHATAYSEIYASQPRCTRWFQAIMAVGLVWVLATSYRARTWSRSSNWVSGVMMMVALAYPFAVMNTSPSLTADAIWLQMQHDNLMWLGGDINVSSEQGQAFWGNKVLSVDIPRQIKVSNLPTNHIAQFGLHQIGDTLNWTGYSDAFCQFSKRGWSMAVSGWAILLIGTILVRGQVQFDRIGGSLILVFIVACLFCAVAVSRPFSAAAWVERAAAETRARRYDAALDALETACRRMPVLSQDTHFIAQRGLLETRLGRNSAYSKLFQAVDLERRGHFDAAYESFMESMESKDPAIARESIRAVQRFAIQDFNSGRAELAAANMKLVLAKQPCNLKAIYLSQICALRQDHREEVANMSEWMDAAASHLSFNSKKILRACMQRYEAVAASQRNDAEEVWFHSTAAKRP